MIDLAFDKNTRDLVLPIQPITGAARVAQSLRIRLRTWLGDWFLDTRHGVPYVESILKGNPNPAIVESILRAQILDVEGVQSITSFSLFIDPATRICSVQFEAVSSEGLAVGSVTLNV